MPTIAIIDRFPILRTGLMILLRNQLKKADFIEAADPNGFEFRQRRKNPDLVILGLSKRRFPDFETVLGQVRASFPDTPVVVYSESLRSEIVLSYIRLELDGYVAKSTDCTEIVRCVGDVLSGRRYLCQAFSDAILRAIYQEPHPNHFTGIANLTYREFRIACQLAKGKSTESIAHSLGEKHAVVERLAVRLISKLNVRNYDELFSRVSRLAHYD